MKLNDFGNTGMRVSEIGFGGSRIGGFFAGKDSSSKEALNVLSRALDAGINFYDTADMYAQGESESLIGKAFRGRRERVIIATKGGFCLPARSRLMTQIKPLVRPFVRALRLKRTSFAAGTPRPLAQNFSAPYLREALEDSLRRLRTDRVDLYQLHSPSAQFMQTEAFGEALAALETLKIEGKLRFYGVATEVPADAPFCLSAPNISSVQLGFGVLDQDALLQGTLAAARARGLAIISRGCFAGGLLKDGPDETELKSMTDKWKRIVALRALSGKAGRGVLEIAYQFCRYSPAISVTLLGMRIEDHLRDILRMVEARPLEETEYAALRDLSMITANMGALKLQ